MKDIFEKDVITRNKTRCAACPVPFTKLIRRYSNSCKAPTKIYILKDLLNIKESSLESACLDP